MWLWLHHMVKSVCHHGRQARRCCCCELVMVIKIKALGKIDTPHRWAPPFPKRSQSLSTHLLLFFIHLFFHWWWLLKQKIWSLARLRTVAAQNQRIHLPITFSVWSTSKFQVSVEVTIWERKEQHCATSEYFKTVNKDCYNISLKPSSCSLCY